MPRIMLLLAVFMVADITIGKVLAKQILRNYPKKLNRHPDKSNDQRDDDYADAIPNIGVKDLRDLVEIGLQAETNYINKAFTRASEKGNQNKKKHNKLSLFDQLTGLDGNDVIWFDPDRMSSQTKREKDSISKLLGSLNYAKSTESNQYKKKQKQASLFDQLTRLDDNEVLLINPDRMSAQTEREKDSISDMLGSLNYDEFIESKQNQKRHNEASVFDQLTGLNENQLVVHNPDRLSDQSGREKDSISDLLESLNFHKAAESKQNKNKRSQASLFDQLTGLDGNQVVMYDPDRMTVQANREKDSISDLLGSLNFDKANDDIDNSSPMIYMIDKVNDRSNADNSINKLLSSLLLQSSSSSQKNRTDGKKQRSGKWFDLNDLYRRSRDSSEKISPASMEGESVLRSRHGSGSGRTPIPYIKHRGDIFEKYE